MENRSIVSIADYSKKQIQTLLDMAAEFEKFPNRELLKGKVVATLFFEPSTRTRLSFETAANRLGARVIGFTDPKVTSSSKGETLKDTIKDGKQLCGCHRDAPQTGRCGPIRKRGDRRTYHQCRRRKQPPSFHRQCSTYTAYTRPRENWTT